MCLTYCCVGQGVELGNIGPDEATKGIESLQTSASQDLSPSSEAPQLQVVEPHTTLLCMQGTVAMQAL